MGLIHSASAAQAQVVIFQPAAPHPDSQNEVAVIGRGRAYSCEFGPDEPAPEREESTSQKPYPYYYSWDNPEFSKKRESTPYRRREHRDPFARLAPAIAPDELIHQQPGETAQERHERRTELHQWLRWKEQQDACCALDRRNCRHYGNKRFYVPGMRVEWD